MGKTSHNVAALVMGLGVVAICGRGGAAVIEDFEPGTTYAGTGTLIADPADSGNQVLSLTSGQFTSFVTPGTTGVVTMRIFDYGVVIPQTSSTNVYGPRWGVADTATQSGASAGASAAVTIINKTFLPATAGYGMQGETAKTGSWFSPQFFGGGRQVTTLDTGSTEENEGVGKWSTWTFDVGSDGKVKISVTGIGASKTSGTVTGTVPVTAMSTIWMYGGSSATSTANGYNLGVLVDDITFTAADPVPEPASLAMLGAGGLMLLRRRRRS